MLFLVDDKSAFIFLGVIQFLYIIFQERIGLGSVVQGGKSKSLLLSELGQDLGTQRERLNKRMQGTRLFISSTFFVSMGCQKNCFIKYYLHTLI